MSPKFSPLGVRTSIRRIRICHDRRRLVFALLWPVPWHFEVPAPLSVTELQNMTDEGEMMALRQPNLMQLYWIPLFRVRDTPLRSLYRFYEDLCSKHVILLSYECAYFFFRAEPRWKLSRIPDPMDPDPVRYTILASFAEALVSSFNWRLKLGLRRDGSQIDGGGTDIPLETAPPWTSKVPPLPETLDLRPTDKDDSNRVFLRRNIRATMGYLFCV